MTLILPPSYLELPAKFYKESRPEVYPDPRIVVYNDTLAKQLGMDIKDPQILSGSIITAGSNPIALGYAGHQFGHYTSLGDGRAILLGEFLSTEGKKFDIQLKGSGRTFFSRRGDGKATLGPMLREYLISEAMAALGIPTTRCLAVLTTGETVNRYTYEPGAILVRIASSHLRVGTFEFASEDQIQNLSDFSISRHFPFLIERKNKYSLFLDEIIKRQASLVASWMSIGFIHGVMNTDNVALSGETIDYGPCAFMNQYDPATVYSSIDKNGRYCFGNQPNIMQWNLARFAETLIPILSDNNEQGIKIATELVNIFPQYFNQSLEDKMKEKLGGSIEYLSKLYEWMYQNQADYTNTFSSLNLNNTDIKDDKFKKWHQDWRKTALNEPINNKVIPRNQRVEEALSAAVINNDYNLFFDLLDIIQHPFDNPPVKYTTSHEPDGYCTFCGT